MRIMKGSYILALVVSMLCCNLLLNRFFLQKDQVRMRGIQVKKKFRQTNQIHVKNASFKKKYSPTKIKPRYQLDPNRFLIPTLHNGPNNQMIGFQQSIFLAILLNRTLVIPLFYLHSLNRNKALLKSTIDAELRFDVTEVQKLLSTKTIQKASELCSGKFEAFFLPYYKPWDRYANVLPRVHLETGLQGLLYKDNINLNSLSSVLNSTQFNVTTLVDKPDERCLTGKLFTGVKTKTTTTLKSIQSKFNTGARCALYLNPFRELGVNVASKQIPNFDAVPKPLKSIKTIGDSSPLFQEISRHVIPPVLVREVSRDFIISFLSPSYISIHWRYDKEDFFPYLCESPDRRKIFCDTINQASNSTAFAHALYNRVTSIGQTTSTFPSVYIAAPTSVKDFIEEVKKIFRSLVKNDELVKVRKVPIFSNHELYSFMKKSKRLGSDFQSQYSIPVFLDILSQVEMEICSHSDVFIWSRQSTWSKLVLERRVLVMGKNNDNGDNVVNFILKTLEGMTNFRIHNRERKKITK